MCVCVCVCVWFVYVFVCVVCVWVVCVVCVWFALCVVCGLCVVLVVCCWVPVSLLGSDIRRSFVGYEGQPAGDDVVSHDHGFRPDLVCDDGGLQKLRGMSRSSDSGTIIKDDHKR